MWAFFLKVKELFAQPCLFDFEVLPMPCKIKFIGDHNKDTVICSFSVCRELYYYSKSSNCPDTSTTVSCGHAFYVKSAVKVNTCLISCSKGLETLLHLLKMIMYNVYAGPQQIFGIFVLTTLLRAYSQHISM